MRFYWEIVSSHYFQASPISLFQALHGFQGYAGGLDTLTGQTGSHTFVTAYMGAKVCFTNNEYGEYFLLLVSPGSGWMVF